MAKAPKGINPGPKRRSTARKTQGAGGREKNIDDAVREICLGLPDTTEVRSHGSPDFRVGGKTFATYEVNHHGAGRIALWLRMGPGAQPYYVEHEPEYYFVPPYVGPKGWLGVQLDQGLSWDTIAQRAFEAWEQVAPKALAGTAAPILIEPPTATVHPMDFDPLQVPVHARRLQGLRKRALALPEVSEDLSFGNPVWRAGKKTFATAYGSERQVYYSFWVGLDAQPQYQMDERFHVPAYTGHNGWIALNVTRGCRWRTVEPLLEGSYRHFALKRMLKILDGA